MDSKGTKKEFLFLFCSVQWHVITYLTMSPCLEVEGLTYLSRKNWHRLGTKEQRREMRSLSGPLQRISSLPQGYLNQIYLFVDSNFQGEIRLTSAQANYDFDP